MFNSKTDFMNGLNDGRVKNLTLVEYAVNTDGDLKTSSHEAIGKKLTVLATTSHTLFFKDAKLETFKFPTNGKWAFKGHTMRVTTDSSEAVFIVNPIF